MRLCANVFILQCFILDTLQRTTGLGDSLISREMGKFTASVLMWLCICAFSYNSIRVLLCTCMCVDKD